jgi:hypothetical protein
MLKQHTKKKLLFYLSDGTPVYKGDVLWHPNRSRVGWACVAEFPPTGPMVTVRSIPAGAVPIVLISELRKEPPEQTYRPRCPTCGKFY